MRDVMKDVFGARPKRLLYSLLAAAVFLSGLALSPTQLAAAPTTCGGLVFQDYDADGERIEDYSFVDADYSATEDDPVAAVEVGITTATGAFLVTTTTVDGPGTFHSTPKTSQSESTSADFQPTGREHRRVQTATASRNLSMLRRTVERATL